MTITREGTIAKFKNKIDYYGSDVTYNKLTHQVNDTYDETTVEVLGADMVIRSVVITNVTEAYRRECGIDIDRVDIVVVCLASEATDKGLVILDNALVGDRLFFGEVKFEIIKSEQIAYWNDEAVAFRILGKKIS